MQPSAPARCMQCGCELSILWTRSCCPTSAAASFLCAALPTCGCSVCPQATAVEPQHSPATSYAPTPPLTSAGDPAAGSPPAAAPTCASAPAASSPAASDPATTPTCVSAPAAGSPAAAPAPSSCCWASGATPTAPALANAPPCRRCHRPPCHHPTRHKPACRRRRSPQCQDQARRQPLPCAHEQPHSAPCPCTAPSSFSSSLSGLGVTASVEGGRAPTAAALAARAALLSTRPEVRGLQGSGLEARGLEAVHAGLCEQGRLALAGSPQPRSRRSGQLPSPASSHRHARPLSIHAPLCPAQAAAPRPSLQAAAEGSPGHVAPTAWPTAHPAAQVQPASPPAAQGPTRHAPPTHCQPQRQAPAAQCQPAGTGAARAGHRPPASRINRGQRHHQAAARQVVNPTTQGHSHPSKTPAPAQAGAAPAIRPITPAQAATPAYATPALSLQASYCSAPATPPPAPGGPAAAAAAPSPLQPIASAPGAAAVDKQGQGGHTTPRSSTSPTAACAAAAGQACGRPAARRPPAAGAALAVPGQARQQRQQGDSAGASCCRWRPGQPQSTAGPGRQPPDPEGGRAPGGRLS
jgi:hypothetical protein